ncbi:MAG: sugar phosphate isomerase/epimerase family protein [Christensenellales bacterium]|jgi:L-ribulose-5-phosphate 3-epimerase
MYSFSIGVMLDSFRTDTASALEKAAATGASGIQVYTSRGEMSAEKLTPLKRREFLKAVRANGLEISALCGDLGLGFGNKERNPKLIDRSKRILELAKDLETNVVTTHIGVVPKDPGHERYKIMQEACFELSRFADSLGAHFAVETGPETAAILKGFLDSLGSKGVAVNYDPANFVMVTGDDPVQGVYTLKDYIVHTHAKDGRRLRECDPEMVYGIIEKSVQEGRNFEELPLGQGDVDFPRYINALHDIGYRGYLTVERETGENPEEDIIHAVNFLKELIGAK